MEESTNEINVPGELDQRFASRGKVELSGSLSIAAQRIHKIANIEEILYAESLARLTDSEGVVHTASAFAPHLERQNRSLDLDIRMLNLVFAALASDETLVLGCNLSASNLSATNRFADVFDLIARKSKLASPLIIEVTETCPLDGSAIERLKMIRALGCRIAVDDFGTGFATPSQLLQVPADIIKIDGIFARDIRQAGDGHDSLYHMVAFASCVAPVIVVECIETRAQFEAARVAGATHVQGFLLSKPGPLPECRLTKGELGPLKVL